MAPDDPVGSAAARLRVMTYNAFQSPRLPYTRDLIDSAHADIVCVQELVVEDFHHQPANQATWLAEALGMHHLSTYTCRGYRRNAGSAILSRFPLGPPEVLIGPTGQRIGLATIVDHPRTPIALLCAHYTWIPRPLVFLGLVVSGMIRSVDARKSLAWLRCENKPGIIAGDFNAIPHSPEYHTVARQMTDCTRAVPMTDRGTRPTWGLPVQLDYIFTTAHFRTRACRKMDCTVSDHRPVVADLEVAEW